MITKEQFLSGKRFYSYYEIFNRRKEIIAYSYASGLCLTIMNDDPDDPEHNYMVERIIDCGVYLSRNGFGWAIRGFLDFSQCKMVEEDAD
jgi:hypothetical protein